MNHSDEILKSWRANAENWITTIDANEIETRTLVTNNAIIETILKYSPIKILDIGCGEGWLTRRLHEHGIQGHGIDAIEKLVDNAIEKGGNHYSVCSYQNVINHNFKGLNEFDAVVINFALLDKEDSDKLVSSLAKLLNKGSLVFIQTLHPSNISLPEYVTGWKDGSWDGLKKDFSHPYQWYFRTLETWVGLFLDSGLTLVELKEPLNPKTGKPASVIFVLST